MPTDSSPRAVAPARWFHSPPAVPSRHRAPIRARATRDRSAAWHTAAEYSPKVDGVSKRRERWARCHFAVAGAWRLKGRIAIRPYGYRPAATKPPPGALWAWHPAGWTAQEPTQMGFAARQRPQPYGRIAIRPSSRRPLLRGNVRPTLIGDSAEEGTARVELPGDPGRQVPDTAPCGAPRLRRSGHGRDGASRAVYCRGRRV